MRIKGIERRRKWKDEKEGFSTLCKIMKGEKKKNNMVEKNLEKKIILNLKMLGCECAKAGETSTYNSHWCLSGMSDLIVFIPNGGVVFMEVKQEKRRNTKNGGLEDSQVKFKELCEKCDIKYMVVYSVKEALEALK